MIPATPNHKVTLSVEFVRLNMPDIMTVEVTEDELVLLIQLLLAKVVASEREKPTEEGQPLPSENALLQKLQQAREAAITIKP